MEQLTSEEYTQLIKLVDERINAIRKDSYTDKAAEVEYTDLGFIKIKLDVQAEMLKGGANNRLQRIEATPQQLRV